jgi:Nuclease-related domain
VTGKRLSLRREDICKSCDVVLPAETVAWWDSGSRVVTGESCHDGLALEDALDDSSSPEPELVPLKVEIPQLQTGEAGRSALDEYKRRHDQRAARIDARFGRFAGVVKFMTDDPQSIAAWKKGSAGERMLAASLQESLGDRAVLLNDRTVPRTKGNIDHLVIASSGVWVVDAKNYSGLVQQRDVGGFFKVDMRLYVGGRDRSKILGGLSWQVKAVAKALGVTEVPISSAVCFTDAEWGWFAKPFVMQGIFVSGPNALARKIAVQGLLPDDEVHDIAVHLSQALPPKT